MEDNVDRDYRYRENAAGTEVEEPNRIIEELNVEMSGEECRDIPRKECQDVPEEDKDYVTVQERFVMMFLMRLVVTMYSSSCPRLRIIFKH